MIQSGLDEGAALVAGGPGRPDGLGCGYYVRPTVFLAENAQAKIVREEIFGPVLVIQTYGDVSEAIELANDTPDGLGAYLSGNNIEELVRVGRRLVAVENRVDGIDADCGGVCSCATCHVYIDKEWVERTGKPSDEELAKLELVMGPAENSRLSCQVKLSESLDGIVVHLPESQQ